MKRNFLYAGAFGLALLAPAGAQDDGGSRIERFLEDSLSGDGRTVTVRGFRGALTGRAELDSLTLSDGNGDWLTLTDAVLDWNRAALLQGRLEIEEITAARIDLPRLPAGDSASLPSPEASGTMLSLPDLPVAVNIGTLSAETLTLGGSVLGQPLQARIDGSMTLENGEGSARLVLVRTDGEAGRIDLDGSYSNASTQLDLGLLFDEGPGGIAAGLLNLPGAPALRLELAGTGPINGFGADLTLQTNGEDRLTARFETTATDDNRLFDVSANGDLRPLVDPSFHPFFGASARLAAQARIVGEVVEIDQLSLQTEALDLQGRGAVATDGLPRRIALAGALASADGGPVVLPVPGGDTTLETAALDIAYDVAAGDQWTGTVTISGLQRPGLAAETVSLEGAGLIAANPNRITLGVDFAARDLDFGNDDAADAFGEAVTGRLDVSWQDGGPLRIPALRITGESYKADVSGTVANLTTSLDLEGRASVSAGRLAAFSGLADRPLAGAIDVTVTGSGEVFTGLLDLRAAALGRDLALGEARFDPYLAGETSIELALRRSTGGLFLDTFRVTGTGVNVEARGDIATGSGALSVAADLADIAPLWEGLSGPAEAAMTATKEDALWTYQARALAMGADVAANGTLSGDRQSADLTASGDFRADDFSRFSALAGSELSGTGSGIYSASARLPGAAISADVEGVLQNARLGIDAVDALLAGQARFAATASREGALYDIPRLSLTSPTGRLEASALVNGQLPLRAAAEVEIVDLATLFPDLSGPASAQVTLAEPIEGSQAFAAAVSSGPVTMSADGQLRDLANAPVAEGRLSANVDDLSAFTTIAGRAIGGALSVDAEGRLAADLETFDVVADLASTNLRSGIRDLDQLLAGAGTLRLDASRADGTITITQARARTPSLSVNASGQVGAQTAFTFDGRLADISPFVPGLSGVVTADGRAETLGNGRAAVNATVTAPAGTQARITGDVADDGSDVNLRVAGQAALGLANRILAPRALSGTAGFDLAVRGAPSLDALSGDITLNGARLIAPVAGLGLTDITGRIALDGAAASVEVESGFEGGGQVRLSGPVALTGSQNADLALTLADVVLTDPQLYQTRLNADLTIGGPLAGGAAIAGRVDVGTTEVRIPSGGGLSSAGLPEITHIGEPAGVRATRSRAGLIGTTAGSQAAAVYGLDVAINAPNQIFVRGRGLDAELGGALRIRGTTANVIPDGRLDLIRGRLDILSQRLEMTSGRVELTGALDPQISLVAETEAEDVDVEIRIEGSASDPTVTLTSRPELPEDEVLALLLFGQGLDNLSPLQIARLAAAVATLGSSGDGLLGGARSGVGLADLDVTSSDSGGAAVRAGTYISDNIYTDLTVDTDGNSEVQLNLDLSDALTVRGRTSTDGNSGLGLFFERDY
ncbi:MAG: translocation/assembly module TamB domain-containing protein [Pseudomonadota bacterium]